ncbi:hypothetical protein Taro_009983 [Colocasia esculenta]|uniref:Uncharacterized protein n=1 Tax=Colocasia esculenta TaxID=4460 RepID=A0A843U2E9_COLES|nr:hypothetical protein [Colocasia esculenta]
MDLDSGDGGREAARLLRKTYFSGGTVLASIANIDFVKRRECIEQLFEDGTLSFLSIASIRHGFKIINTLTVSAIARGGRFRWGLRPNMGGALTCYDCGWSGHVRKFFSAKGQAGMSVVREKSGGRLFADVVKGSVRGVWPLQGSGDCAGQGKFRRLAWPRGRVGFVAVSNCRWFKVQWWRRPPLRVGWREMFGGCWEVFKWSGIHSFWLIKKIQRSRPWQRPAFY